MACQHVDSRRRFLRYAMIGGIAVPVYSGLGLLSTAHGKAFNLSTDLDLENLTDMERMHLPNVTLPPVVEDGSQAPIQVGMEHHPMEEDHYIRSIHIINYADPVQAKGTFYFTPTNGEAFLATQIRLSGGESRVWVIAECNQHGKWAASADTKVAAGGC